MNFRQIVEGTKAFKGLSKMQRELTLKRQNLGVIENGVNVANHLGIEQWEQQSNFNYINKPIVLEIVHNKLVTTVSKPVPKPAGMLQFNQKGYVSFLPHQNV